MPPHNHLPKKDSPNSQLKSGPEGRSHLWMLGAVALLVVGQFVLNGYLQKAELLSGGQWSLVLLLELVLTLGALAWIWHWLEARVFQPLKRLAEEITLIAHGNAGHQPQMDTKSQLGPLPGAISQLGTELLRARSETRQAMETASSQVVYRNARLEAILRDLAEGLVVCNLEHHIVLLNQVAQHLLGDVEELGLGRSLGLVLDEEQLHRALAELQRERVAEAATSKVIEFSCPLTANEAESLDARMSLIIESNGECAGYVLTLTPRPSGEEGHSGDLLVREQVAQPPRPEFYDFNLFESRKESSLLDLPLSEAAFTVFDTETTGLKPSQGDEMVQIAGVRIINRRLLTAEAFDRLINPGRSIPPSSTRFHGITDAMVADHPPIDVVLPAFERFAQESVLVAHNAAFDMKCLEMKEQTTQTRFDHPVMDTLLLSVLLHPAQRSHSLEAVCERFGVINEGRHTALGDAMATAKVLLAMFPLLEERGLNCLRDVIKASNQIYEMRSLQAHF